MTVAPLGGAESSSLRLPAAPALGRKHDTEPQLALQSFTRLVRLLFTLVLRVL